MKRTITVEAKKVEEAIKQGLMQLGVSQDEAEIKIISTGGFFKKAKIEMTVEKEDEFVDAINERIANQKVEADKIEIEKPVVTKKVEAKKVENKPAMAAKPAVAKESTVAPAVSAKAEEKAVSAPLNQPKKQSEPKGKPVALKQTAQLSEEDKIVKSAEKSNKLKRKGDKRRERELEPITEETTQKAVSFVTELVKLMGVEGAVSASAKKGLTVTVDTKDTFIIGHHGETLDAIEYLTSLVVNGTSKGYSQIDVDALNYRAKRINTLKRIADDMAAKCVAEGRKVALKPMNSAERKIIHAHLSENDSVVTKSEGKEPSRKLVVFPRKG